MCPLRINSGFKPQWPIVQRCTSDLIMWVCFVSPRNIVKGFLLQILVCFKNRAKYALLHNKYFVAFTVFCNNRVFSNFLKCYYYIWIKKEQFGMILFQVIFVVYFDQWSKCTTDIFDNQLSAIFSIIILGRIV